MDYSTVKNYLAYGFCLIPLKAGRKEPDIGSWRIYQTRIASEREVNSWFQPGGSRNVGIVCGQVSNYLSVIDFDTPDLLWPILGKNVDQLALYTMFVKTGKGYHVYFQDKNHEILRGKNFREKDDNLSVAIDFKSEGGYVVAPPSIHPSGAIYEAMNVLPPRQVEMGRLFAELLVPRIRMYTLARMVDPYYKEGHRHDFALHFITYLRYRYKFSIEDIGLFFEILGIIQLQRGVKQHDPKDIEQITEDVYKQELGDVPVGKAVSEELIKQLEKYTTQYSHGEKAAVRSVSDVIWQSTVSASDVHSTWIECTKDGVFQVDQRLGKRGSAEIVMDILSEPMELRDAWRVRTFITAASDTDMMEFEVQIRDDVFRGKVSDILTSIIDHCPYVKSRRMLPDALNHCINHYIGSGIVKVNQSYAAIGVFSDTFELVTPGDINKPIHVIPGSEAERFVVLYRVRDGDLYQTLKTYAELYKWYPEGYLATIMGWAAMAPFFYMLKSIPDFYTAMLILRGSRGTGKSTLANLCSTWLYGGIDASPDDMATAYRLADLWASTTFPRFVDEAEKINLSEVIKNSSINDILKKGLFTQIARRIGSMSATNRYYPSFAALLIAGNRVDITDEALQARSIILNFSERQGIKDQAIRHKFQTEVQNQVVRAIGPDLITEIIQEYPTKIALHEAIRSESSKISISLMDARRADIYGTIRVGIMAWHKMFEKYKIPSFLGKYMDVETFNTAMMGIENQNVEEGQEVNILSGFITWLQGEASALSQVSQGQFTSLQAEERASMIKVRHNSPMEICFTQTALALYRTTLDRDFPIKTLSEFADRYSEMTSILKNEIYDRGKLLAFNDQDHRMKYARIKVSQQELSEYGGISNTGDRSDYDSGTFGGGG